MKFKTIFFLFNIVLIIAFLFVLLMPILLIGQNYFSLFISKDWFVLVLFFLCIAGVNTYFILNWKLFRLLETEDWQTLSGYLEEQVYEKKRIRKIYVKMLLNAYFLNSEMDKINKLEKYLKNEKPQYLLYFSVEFGIPYLINSDAVSSESYFGKLLASRKTANVEWIRWNYAFALMQKKEFEAAKAELLKLYGENTNPLIFLLTLYLLDSFAKMDIGVKSKVDEGIKKLRNIYGLKKIDKELESNSDNIEVVILSQIIREAKERYLTLENNRFTPDTVN
ncbi:MAG: hypothetical protein J7K04_10355 [Spirochaetales bacterium]|nr:hypothetical protein [Spirochaetales bacterium]